MKITNKANLPKQFEQIAQSWYKYKPKQYSATSLLMSLRELMLKRRYNDEIEQDCSDLIWALVGSGVHKALEEYGENHYELKEERLEEVVYKDYKLSGYFDLYNAKTKTITDYKTTSTWSVIYKNDYPKWEKQLNIYAYLLEKAGFEVEKLQIITILRDWQRTRAKHDLNYPQSQVQVIEFNKKDIEKWIIERFKEIEHYEQIQDHELPLCTEEERFNDGNKFAVTKKGNKKALRVFDNEEMAKTFINDHKDKEKLFIDVRLGVDKKCLEYCSVAPFCSYYQEKYGGELK